MKPLTLIGLIGLLALRSDAAWITPADFNTNQFSTAGGKISLVNTNPIGTNVFSAAAAIATNGPDLNPLLTTASSLNAANLTGTLSLNAPTATIATNAPDGYRLLSTNSTLKSIGLTAIIKSKDLVR